MNGLITEMLDVTRLQGEVFALRKQENVDLVTLVRSIVEQQSFQNHRISMQIGEEAILITVDKDRIEQVLNNLLSNADKYSPAGSPIQVTVERRQASNEVVVAVRDEGDGIAEEDQIHLFERFYRVHSDMQGSVDGLGLGLYISHNIVKQHGGGCGWKVNLVREAPFSLRCRWKRKCSVLSKFMVPLEMTMKVTWRGVIPAITTRFQQDYSIDHAFFADHCRTLVDAGCVGLITPGSLGESATLSFQEKVALLETTVRAVGDRVPVLCGVAALSTAEAVRLAYTAQAAGCSGLMVLPPYVYSTDWREMKAHVATVIASTSLPTMLYNNPPAYITDFLPEQIAELAHENANLEAVKESSADVRRITALRALLQDRLALLAGVDDCIVESIQAGAVGWVAGLANAFPRESVALFNLAMQVRKGEKDAVSIDSLYNWFLPLLRLDTGPKFVQYIKLAQEMAGVGSARVRAPRLELTGAELEMTKRIIQHALDTRPSLPG